MKEAMDDDENQTHPFGEAPEGFQSSHYEHVREI